MKLCGDKKEELQGKQQAFKGISSALVSCFDENEIVNEDDMRWRIKESFSAAELYSRRKQESVSQRLQQMKQRAPELTLSAMPERYPFSCTPPPLSGVAITPLMADRLKDDLSFK